jgi:hypothetical protein
LLTLFVTMALNFTHWLGFPQSAIRRTLEVQLPAANKKLADLLAIFGKKKNVKAALAQLTAKASAASGGKSDKKKVGA